jgi:hypothetical protein
VAAEEGLNPRDFKLKIMFFSGEPGQDSEFGGFFVQLVLQTHEPEHATSA